MCVCVRAFVCVWGGAGALRLLEHRPPQCGGGDDDGGGGGEMAAGGSAKP